MARILLTMREWRRYRAGTKPIEQERDRLAVSLSKLQRERAEERLQARALMDERDQLLEAMPNYDAFVAEVEAMRVETERIRNVRAAQIEGTMARAVAESKAVARADEQLARCMQRYEDLVKSIRDAGLDLVKIQRGRVMTLKRQVSEFHEMTGQPIRQLPTVPPDDEVRTRLRLIVEECFELLDACLPKGPPDVTPAASLVEEAYRLAMLAIDHVPVKVDMVEVADALADIAYVVEGTNLSFGIDSATVLAEVQRSNLSKKGGSLNALGKFEKPPGFIRPNIAGVLEQLSSKDVP